MLAALERGDGAGAVAGRRGGDVRARAGGAARGTRSCCSTSTPDTAWQRAGGRRPLARDRQRFDELHAPRSPLYERLADAILPTSRRDSLRQRPAGDPAAAADGAKLLWAESAVGQLPGLRRRGAARLPAGRPAAPSPSPTSTSPRTTAPPTTFCRRGRSTRRWRPREAVLRAMAAAGDRPRRPRGRARRRRRRRRRRVLRGRLPARHRSRAGADHGRRAGRLRLRRQDRRRPARGQELRRRLPPAAGGRRRPGGADHAARRRRRRPDGRRSSRPP